MTTTDFEALKRLYVTQCPDADLDAFEVIELILNTSVEDIFKIIDQNQPILLPITSANIPQFSKADEIFSVLRVVIDSRMEDLNHEKIGYYLCSKNAKAGARVKYGENHYKLAAQLGLTTEIKPLAATDLGMAYYLTESSAKRSNIKKKLALRIPLIQQALILAEDSTFNIAEYMLRYLSKSTMLRRRSNIRELLQYIMDNAGVEMQHRLNNIVWG
ncbi:MAG: hypothetical protein Q8865_03915 [Bacillota bacterium]|nr:hypothetical protein [Bacillota bacterium]